MHIPRRIWNWGLQTSRIIALVPSLRYILNPYLGSDRIGQRKRSFTSAIEWRSIVKPRWDASMRVSDMNRMVLNATMVCIRLSAVIRSICITERKSCHLVSSGIFRVFFPRGATNIWRFLGLEKLEIRWILARIL